MKSLIILCTIIAAVYGQSRIINGDDAREYEFPYQAYISINQCMLCGASIIHKRWLLTAAHCVTYCSSVGKYGNQKASNLTYANEQYTTELIESNSTNKHHLLICTVTVGTIKVFGGNGINHEIEELISHEDYNPVLFINDITLIRVKNDIQFNDKVQPIALPKDDEDKYFHKRAIVSGWGCTSQNCISSFKNKLQFIKVRVIKQSKCLKYYPYNLMESHICTSTITKSVCFGDSGGPVVVGEVQVGIVSTSFCSFKVPDVHTRISSFLPWIRKKMDLYSDISEPVCS